MSRRLDRIGQVCSFRRPFGAALERAGKFDLRIRHDFENQLFGLDARRDLDIWAFFVCFFCLGC
jgi:hypothetical protein